MVAEHWCSQCRTPFLNPRPIEPDGVCALCRSGAVSFQQAFCYGSYDGELARLIHLFKYVGVRTLAAPLGELVARALPLGQSFDLIVPMPLHWWKRLTRTFNQSDLLAAEVSRRTGIPWSRALRRVKRTTTQAGLTSAERRLNVRGAFRASRPAAVAGKRILLIDDVLTTGATAASAAAVLRRAGAAHIAVLALARVDRRMPETVMPGSAKFTANSYAVSGGL
jgi:ComF family protein